MYVNFRIRTTYSADNFSHAQIYKGKVLNKKTKEFLRHDVIYTVNSVR